VAKSKLPVKEKPVSPKARNDAYVMLLVITFFAIVTGCVLMYLDNEEYGKNPPPKETIPNVSKLGEADTKSEAGAAPKIDAKVP
jgi:hypothetical protein